MKSEGELAGFAIEPTDGPVEKDKASPGKAAWHLSEGAHWRLVPCRGVGVYKRLKYLKIA